MAVQDDLQEFKNGIGANLRESRKVQIISGIALG